jgi:hypothetical protein
MTYHRLTNDDRSLIVKRLVAHKFDKEIAAVEQEIDVFCEKALKSSISEHEQTILDGLPAGIACEVSSVVIHTHSSGDASYLIGKFKNPVRVPYRTSSRKHYSTNYTLISVSDPELSMQGFTLAVTKENLQKEKKEAGTRAKAYLSSITSLSSLIKGWPEIEPLCYGIGSSKTKNLPAPLVDSLNKTFDLPVGSVVEGGK